jgi:hypothetical protein
LPSDCYNLANYLSKNVSFGHAIQQRQLEKAAITAFQEGDTASANRLANEAAEMTTSGYVEDIFKLENEAQKRGSFLSMLVPVGTILKGLGAAAKVFRGAKALDASADAAKIASTVGTLEVSVGGVYVASVSSSGSAAATIVRVIRPGEKIADLIAEGKALTFATGNEHALVSLTNGQRVIVSGGPTGIDLSGLNVRRLLGHSHPYHLAPTGPSPADFDALKALGQRSSYLLEHGTLTKFGGEF